MAEAIARYDAADVIEPSSAGLHPLGVVAEQTKQTLMENGYAADWLTSDPLTRGATEDADIVINMTGKPRDENFWEPEKVEDWLVEDPYGEMPTTYQRVFESIKRRVDRLAAGLREKKQNSRAAN